MKYVYTVLTHVCNQFVEDNIAKLSKEIGRENIFVCFDNTNGAFDAACFPGFNIFDCDHEVPTILQGPAVILTNTNIYKGRNNLHVCSRDTYESHIALMYDALKLSYDFMWLIEYDVACNGSWQMTFRKMDNDISDFVAKDVVSWHEHNDKRWDGWHKLIMYDIPYERRWSAFVPVSRYSHRFMRCLRENLGVKSGYVECFIPTICHDNGFTSSSLPNTMIGRIYTFRWHTLEDFGRCCEETPNENKFYHPIKPEFKT
jgi:hypothetical protein